MININKQFRAVFIIMIAICVLLTFNACAHKTEPIRDQVDIVAASDDDTYELQIIIQDSPPFSYAENGIATGFVTEIVSELMSRQLITTSFTLLPFKRGFELVSKRPMTVLCGMTRTKERENLFKWVGPVAQVNMGFYALRDSKIQLKSLEDAKEIESIGVILGNYTEQLLIKEGFENIYAVSYPKSMFENLASGRNPLILSDNIAVNGRLTSYGTSLIDVKMIYQVASTNSYLAFSLNTPDEIVKQWQDAYNSAYLDGTLQNIYQDWLPNETFPSLN